MKEYDGKSFIGYLKKEIIDQAREIEMLKHKLAIARVALQRISTTPNVSMDESSMVSIHALEDMDDVGADNGEAG